jgi:hypothetical protein
MTPRITPRSAWLQLGLVVLLLFPATLLLAQPGKDGPAKYAVTAFNRYQKSLQECVDNNTDKDHNSNPYDRTLASMEKKLKEIESKDPGVADHYRQIYQKFKDHRSKQLTDAIAPKSSSGGNQTGKATAGSSGNSGDKATTGSSASSSGTPASRIAAAGLADVGEPIPMDNPTQHLNNDYIMKSALFGGDVYQVMLNAEKLDHGVYQRKKAWYIGQGEASPTVMKYFAKMDRWYAETVPMRLIPKVKGIFDPALDKAERQFKEEPQENMDALLEYLPYMDGFDQLAPGNATVADMRKNIMAYKKRAKEYIDSGKYAQYMKERREAMIEARRLKPVGMRDAALESMVRKQCPAVYGTVETVNINSGRWIVLKNDIGIPTEKTLVTEVLVRKDGKCYIVRGYINSKYEGGGRYGTPYYSPWGPHEMNCANVR